MKSTIDERYGVRSYEKKRISTQASQESDRPQAAQECMKQQLAAMLMPQRSSSRQ
jgi:hypothetical protein